MFNKKKKQIETLKNNNKFLAEVNTNLRKDNISYQRKLFEIKNMFEEANQRIEELKKEKANLKRKVTILEKEKKNGTN